MEKAKDFEQQQNSDENNDNLVSTEINFENEQQNQVQEYAKQIDSQPKKNKKPKKSVSLFTNPKISAKFRYGVPLIIILNIFLFIDANLNPGATVSANVELAGLQSPSVDMKKFTLIDSVADMWKAGVYPLAFFIAFFSGLWPYIKLIMMFACWMIPENIMNYDNRETFLVILDATGKWSLVDSYVLILLVVSFRLRIEEHFVQTREQLNIQVTPNWGFYGFVLAAIVSLVITHIILHQHRKLKQLKAHQKKATSNLQNKNKTRQIFTIGALVFSTVLLIAGSFIHSFAFGFEGLAGYILPEDKQRVNYSLVSLGYLFPSDMPDPNSFEARWVQALFFTVSLILPFIFLTLLTVLYLQPLKIQIQQKLFDITEIIYAWSTLDVMILSVIVTLVEIKQFAAYTIGDNCDGINQVIKLINDNPDIHISVDPPICFGVQTYLDDGCILLFASAFVFFLLGSITLRRLKQRIDKKVKSIHNNEQSCFSGEQLQENLLGDNEQNNGQNNLSSVQEQQQEHELQV